MENIIKLYRKAKREHIEAGLNWYRNASAYAEQLAEAYGVSYDKVCGVISALSPGCSWEINKRDAEKLIFLHVHELHEELSEARIATYGQNIIKALSILEHAGLETIAEKFFPGVRSGQKTRAFYLNIFDPENDEPVTIDRHAIAIYEGFKTSISKGLTPRQYDRIAEAYRAAAKRLGILPQQLQAVTWVAHKEINLA